MRPLKRASWSIGSNSTLFRSPKSFLSAVFPMDCGAGRNPCQLIAGNRCPQNRHESELPIARAGPGSSRCSKAVSELRSGSEVNDGALTNRRAALPESLASSG